MIWALLGAVAVGLSLGLLGSGGAILTVPILVYLAGHNEKAAIAESLAIVGAIAAVGAARAWMRAQVDPRSAALLAFPGIAGAFAGTLGARLIPGAVQLAVVGVLMLTAAALMLRRSPTTPASDPDPLTPRATSLAILQGFGLGLVTGLVGVGGGFLIVPVLVLLRKLPMPTAVGTSLAIITVNSAAGFLTNLFASHAPGLNWTAIGAFTACGIAGSFAGSALAGRMPQATLKKVFAAFLVLMAVYILIRQAPRVLPGIFGTTAPATHVQWEPSAATPPPKERKD